MPKCVERWVTNMSNSSKLPSSSRISMRSRAVSLPLSCCALIRFSPPPNLASALESISFFILSCLLILDISSLFCSWFCPRTVRSTPRGWIWDAKRQCPGPLLPCEVACQSAVSHFLRPPSISAQYFQQHRLYDVCPLPSFQCTW